MGNYNVNFLEVDEARAGGNSNTQLRNEMADIVAACKRIADLLDKVTSEAIPQDGSSKMHDSLVDAFTVIKNDILYAVEDNMKPVIMAWEEYAQHIEAADMKG